MEKTFGTAPLSAVGQRCSTDGCENPATYKTRSQPAWCTDCIDVILAEGGLAAVEPFEGPKAWRLTRCLDCGVQAHYRFVYTLDKNAVGEKTCRACYWKEWAKDARALAGESPFRRVYSSEEIVAHTDKNGYDLIATTAEVNDGDDPIIVCCRACKRISAERMGDIGWGCSCSRNVRSSSPASNPAATPARNILSANPTSPKKPKALLAESDDPAKEWWDHDTTTRRPSVR